MTPETAVYSLTARVFHWLTAVLVLVAITAGIVMNRLGEGPLVDFLYDFHRSIGAVLIPIILLRLIYRLSFTAPPLPADIPAVQRFAASAVHMALYALLIVQPLLGWVATSAYRAPIPIFGLFELPPIWPENRALSEQLFVVHSLIGFAIAGLLCAHIGGALYHHFIRRDDVLRRMWA